MMKAPSNRIWPDARGWVGIGIFLLTVAMLAMMWADKSLRDNQFFQNLSILIIGTGFINGVVSWAYSATQGGMELANRNAGVVEKVAQATADKGNAPQEVKVVNEQADPVPTITDPTTPTEELPDYAK